MRNQTPAQFSGEDPGSSFADLSVSRLAHLHSSVSVAGQQGPPEATLAGTQVSDSHCSSSLSFIPMSLLTLRPLTTCLRDPSLPLYPYFLGTPPVAVTPFLLALSCRASQCFHSFVSHASPQKLSLPDLSAT